MVSSCSALDEQSKVTPTKTPTITLTETPQGTSTPSQTPTSANIPTTVARMKEKKTATARLTQEVLNQTGTIVALMPTATLTPSRTPRNTSTPSPSPTTTPYPTFELSQVKTRTPSPPAKCPPENPELQLSLDVSLDTNPGDYVDFIQQAFDEGATIQQVAKEFNEFFSQYYGAKEYLSLIDLNGDRIDELVVYWLNNMVILGCHEGKNLILLDYGFDNPTIMTQPQITYVEDMNLNGIPDVVIEYPITTGWDSVVDILEWNGSEFVKLIQTDHGENSRMTSHLARALFWYNEPGSFIPELTGAPIMNSSANIEVSDLDGNFTKELILTDSGPVHPATLYDYGPWRGKQVTFTWDGIHYLYSDLKIEPAEYRFQAVQDADRQFLLGNYDEALALYRDVIFNGELEWWTEERRYYIFNVAMNQPVDKIPEPNPDEYPSLEAYSRYRIMLHHVVHGWNNDAEIVYHTLQGKFPEGVVGHEYTKLANLFWNEYAKSNNIESACALVVDYATSNMDILNVLGGWGHGSQSHRYIPEDLCPFP
jgi:hypothetical protein